MNESIYRKKSVEKLSSPDDLNEYITVVKPSLWLILGTIVITLIGTCIWGLFGTIESKYPVGVTSNGSQCYTVCSVDNISVITSSVGVRVNGKFYEKNDAESIVSSVDTSQMNEGYCVIYFNIKLPQGEYSADVIREIIHPFDFLTSE